MRMIALVSLSALALTGCAAKEVAVGVTAAPVAVAAPYAPVIPTGMGGFAQASTLPFHAPDFSKIKDSDFQPAILQGIAINKAEIEAIAGNPAEPTFENTLTAVERSGQMLTRSRAVFSALTAANTNATLDAIDSATAPQLAALQDSIYLNDRLFARIKHLRDKAADMGYRPDQARLLKLTYDRFVKNGALLVAADKEQLEAINGKLSSLQTEFGQKLTAGTRDAALVVDRKAKLAGLDEAALAAAAKAAADRGLAGKFVLPLQNTTQQPLLPSLSNRATRQGLFNASWTRSVRGDANDTRDLIQDIALLRAQKAQLLGYPDFASLALTDQMARTPANALGFMAQIVPALAAAERREAAQINATIRQSGGKFAVEPWDWDYYAEKLRKTRYGLDDAQVRPYFEITRVLEDGVFFAANQLYGLTFKQRRDIPVYHPDVAVYTVFDKGGSELALFYFDPWTRDNKRGGAWMSNFVGQSKLFGTKPVIFNVCNFTKPAAGQPALITADDVNTMFHEFGHALHGILSDQTYPSISGSNTARDFVEFPSQFNENWASEPRVFANYAKHYKTGAAMPVALLTKIEKARKFGKGYALGEAITAALLDMKWHALPASAGKQDADGFEAQALSASGLEHSFVPPRYRSSYFRHIWGGGYAAAYYAYSWTQMLDHDAYQWFVDNGGMTRANGQRFRDMVLSQGNSRDYAEMYKAFAGRDPSIEPMLKANGLR